MMIWQRLKLRAVYYLRIGLFWFADKYLDAVLIDKEFCRRAAIELNAHAANAADLDLQHADAFPASMPDEPLFDSQDSTPPPANDTLWKLYQPGFDPLEN